MKMITFPLPTYRISECYIDQSPTPHQVRHKARSNDTTIAIMIDNISHATKGAGGLTRIHLKTAETIDVDQSLAMVVARINEDKESCDMLALAEMKGGEAVPS